MVVGTERRRFIEKRAKEKDNAWCAREGEEREERIKREMEEDRAPEEREVAHKGTSRREREDIE